MLILFAHGAGAGSQSPWMQSWVERLSTLGRVVTFDYPYMARGRKSPDRLPKLIEAHRAMLGEHRREGEAVLLAGKSMGSRVGCHLALEEEAAGLVCLGYPLVGGGKTRSVRDEVLMGLRTPIHFVQGTRDPLCPLATLDDVRGRMTTRTSLHIVDSGNHSLTTTKGWQKTTGLTQEDADQAALASIAEFQRSL